LTIASGTTAEFSIDAICTMAYRLAGLLPIQQPMDATQGTHARDMLELVIRSLQSKGVFARSVSFYDLTLTGATSSAATTDYIFTLPNYVLDVEGNGMYIPAGETVDRASSETLVQQIGQSQWHELAAKNSIGTPLFMYVHRVSQLQLYLWPMPNEAGTIRLQIHRLFANSNSSGTATLDLERPWQEYVAYELAGHLAVAASLPTERVLLLKGQATALLKECRGFANRHTGSQIVVSHNTGWNR
jgi:hypothetical protein